MMDPKEPEVLQDADLDEANGGLKIHMNDLLITSYQTGGSEASEPDTPRVLKRIDKSSPI